MKNKRIFKTFSALCAAMVLMMGLSVTAFAQGTEQPPAEDATNDANVVVEETEDSPALTPDGNAALVDDFGGNKQLITVTTKAGNYFYILIDRANEDKETAVHFLNQVDEADLMVLMEGDSGKAVEQMQDLLTIIAYFDNSIPLPAMNGVFDARTKNSLTAFQTQYGLEPTGVLNRQSANMLLSVYRDTRAMATENGKSVSRLIYPGRAILRGRTGADVEDLQSLINRAAAQNAFIPQVAEDGIFGEATENAVKAVQAHEGLDVNGIVGPLTWQALLRLSGLSP